MKEIMLFIIIWKLLLGYELLKNNCIIGYIIIYLAYEDYKNMNNIY
jgi:hypothetical protein